MRDNFVTSNQKKVLKLEHSLKPTEGHKWCRCSRCRRWSRACCSKGWAMATSRPSLLPHTVS